MSPRIARSIAAMGFLFVSACASHAPTVECDKRLSPINVGETLHVPPLHRDIPSAEKPKS
jgi:hypothetical protein